MTTELMCLLAAVLLQFVLIMTAALPRLVANGVFWSLSNRDVPSKPVGEWANRAQRASDNFQENLVLFAILVLVADSIAANTDITVLGAQIFLGARLAHAVLYVAGVKVIRTISWAVSVVGMVMIATAMF